MPPGVYKIDIAQLNPSAIDLLTKLGCPRERLESGVINADELPDILSDLLNNYLPSHRALNAVCDFVVSSDGDKSSFSEKDEALLKKLHGLDFHFVSCAFFRHKELNRKVNSDGLERIGVGYEMLSDTSAVFYLKDEALAREYVAFSNANGFYSDHLYFLSDILRTGGVVDTSCHRFPEDGDWTLQRFTNYHKTMMENSGDEEAQKLIEEIKSRSDHQTIRETVYACNMASMITDYYFSNERGIKEPRIVDINAFSLEELRILNDALQLAASISERTGKEPGEVIRELYKYKGVGFGNALLFLHYFVNPDRYPKPDGAELLPGQLPKPLPEKLEAGFIEQLSVIFQPDSEFIPEKALLAGGSVRALLHGVKQEKFFRSIDGSMVCVDTYELDGKRYGIFATASHVMNGELAPQGFEVYKGPDLSREVSLISMPLGSQNPPSPIKIAGEPADPGFVFTLNNHGRGIQIGSDPRYIRSYSSRSDGMDGYSAGAAVRDNIILFRGLNVPRDSGGAIVNAGGELIGIILGGDMKLTVAGYANMKELSNAVQTFKEQLSSGRSKVTSEQHSPEIEYFE